ncbi:MAG: M14 family zinc carboxypeptidase [Psychroserpens sp.]|uniref:M14 family zinc carboxypeptidase n=1 Tax=Psychroserpens sp. TaxID=2020870 RepID=UPI003CC21BCF
MTIETLKSLFQTHKETSLFGRYIYHQSIAPLLKSKNEIITVDVVGTSVNKLPIHVMTLGLGKIKILMWSQMHGNESTTTKAVFDLCNVLSSHDANAKQILKSCTIQIIPILNPDGAKAYTRVNANGIDLNRDAQDLSQQESQVLRSVLNSFQPDYCFNLHDQRTIFSAGEINSSATVSFLAPSQDEERSISPNRKIAMVIISKMNDTLQLQIENQVGLYDDAFNLNCVGDTIQASGVPTLLFEAGHFPQDYMREQTREFIFQSLLVAVNYISEEKNIGTKYETYFKIPKNKKLFYDIIIRNSNKGDIAIQYQEKLIDDRIEFLPKVEKICDLQGFYGHKEIEANGFEVLNKKNQPIEAGYEIDFVMINNEKFLMNL